MKVNDTVPEQFRSTFKSMYSKIRELETVKKLCALTRDGFVSQMKACKERLRQVAPTLNKMDLEDMVSLKGLVEYYQHDDIKDLQQICAKVEDAKLKAQVTFLMNAKVADSVACLALKWLNSKSEDDVKVSKTLIQSLLQLRAKATDLRDSKYGYPLDELFTKEADDDFPDLCDEIDAEDVATTMDESVKKLEAKVTDTWVTQFKKLMVVVEDSCPSG